jgi:uncharacterized membrane protein YqiK
MFIFIVLMTMVALVFISGGITLIGKSGAITLGAIVCLTLGSLIMFVELLMVLWLKFYIKTSASRAFYVTGMGSPKVVIDGGSLVIPLVHELTPVLLQTMKLEVNRKGVEALICKDFLRVDVAAEFYIRVSKTDEGVKAAATTLGMDAMNPEAVKLRFMEKLISALRTVAATMDLNELHQNREVFGAAVTEAVTKDIEPNGLILETVTISQLDQTDVKNLKPENVFDAQGLQKATEITQIAAVKKNKFERDAELAITHQNVTTRKEIIMQEQDKAFAEADQQALVANREAQRKREVAEFEIAQQEEVEKRGVLKDQAVRTAEIQREAILIDEEKNRETANVNRDRAIEVAEREKSIALAEAEGRRADAQANQRLAEAKEQEAAEKVVTAAQVEVARREKAKAVIKAETNLIQFQKKADAEAYQTTRKATAEKEAAENEAFARIRIAEAEFEAKKHEANGQRAIQMVPVEVDAEKVKIEEQRVQVLRKELQAKEEFSNAAIQLEISKLQVEAGKQVGTAMADSIGTFMSKGNFQIFGDPQSLANMTQKFSDGLGLSQVIAGLSDANPLIANVIEGGLKAAEASLGAVSAKAKEIAKKAGNTTSSENDLNLDE